MVVSRVAQTYPLLPDPATMAMTLLRPTENVQEAWEGEGEVERILHGLDVVSELDEAFMFRQPVDLEEEPMYCVAVPFPTDLSTIRERLQNQFYRFVSKVVVNSLIHCHVQSSVTCRTPLLSTCRSLMHCKPTASLVPRPHPLTRRNCLVNQVEFLGLAHTFVTVLPCNVRNIL